MALADVILPLARQGIPPRDIVARHPELKLGTVYYVVSTARSRGDAIPHFKYVDAPAASRTMVMLPKETRQALTDEAAARGVKITSLIRTLLIHIARDQMVAAILDDAEVCDD